MPPNLFLDWKLDCVCGPAPPPTQASDMSNPWLTLPELLVCASEGLVHCWCRHFVVFQGGRSRPRPTPGVWSLFHEAHQLLLIRRQGLCTECGDGLLVLFWPPQSPCLAREIKASYITSPFSVSLPVEWGGRLPTLKKTTFSVQSSMCLPPSQQNASQKYGLICGATNLYNLQF